MTGGEGFLTMIPEDRIEQERGFESTFEDGWKDGWNEALMDLRVLIEAELRWHVDTLEAGVLPRAPQTSMHLQGGVSAFMRALDLIEELRAPGGRQGPD